MKFTKWQNELMKAALKTHLVALEDEREIKIRSSFTTKEVERVERQILEVRVLARIIEENGAQS